MPRRANSTQSLRIRGLETETSRLLSENISLREQVIRVQSDIPRECTPEFLDRLMMVKAKLDEKVKEVGGLVDELGSLSIDRGVLGSTPSENVPPAVGSPGTSPLDQGRRKSGFPLADVPRVQDGRLPSIIEGKVYPRQSLRYVVRSRSRNGGY